jgi:hypothetical protein
LQTLIISLILLSKDLHAQNVNFIDDSQLAFAPDVTVGGAIEQDLSFDSQQQNVSGVVIDALTRETLSGVSVLVKGATAGAITDVEGQYSIEVPGPDAVLVFSCHGPGGWLLYAWMPMPLYLRASSAYFCILS